MSPSALRWHSCRRKRFAHETRKEAWEHAKRLGGGLRPYSCAYCNKYHVGHPTKNPALRIKKKRTARFGGKHARFKGAA